jgi:hypothetical protein
MLFVAFVVSLVALSISIANRQEIAKLKNNKDK